MPVLDIAALQIAPLQHDPFDYVLVPGFVNAAALADINRDFPAVPGPGSYPPARLDIRGRFGTLLDELDGVEFQTAIAEKFGVDLSGYPTMFTVRGFCRLSDGKIHNDSETKIITVLLYLNPPWEAGAGRLRLLRGPDDLNDMTAEVPPDGGSLLVFRRAANSWHGHEPYEGQRRAIQMNWVRDAGVVRREQLRHRISAAAKRLVPFV
ncbi:MAG: 2OG-Fe(II) oxygenase [Alphaproteobacteria bacterium]